MHARADDRGYGRLVGTVLAGTMALSPTEAEDFVLFSLRVSDALVNIATPLPELVYVGLELIIAVQFWQWQLPISLTGAAFSVLALPPSFPWSLHENDRSADSAMLRCGRCGVTRKGNESKEHEGE